ncbi:hypothetical protein [Parashewanella tropica]|uniref:hypothetical protein n=1 Tax=Parashewanella tropica TaxID=2547970 RepID=UPI001059FA5C|nr:hypothetical protein [Parashewanella tropica]
MRALFLVNVFFALVLGAFLLLPITSNWAWLGLITAWCVSEGILARDKNIKWWHFALLFGVLGSLEVALIFYATAW